MQLRFDGAVGDAQNFRRLERACKGATGATIEQCKVTEEVAGNHQRDDALPGVEWLVVDGDRNATREHDVQGIGGVAFVEQDIAADE